MPSINVDLSIAEVNLLLECLSSAIEFVGETVETNEFPDEETREAMIEKGIIASEIGLKLAKLAVPYMKPVKS